MCCVVFECVIAAEKAQDVGRKIVGEGERKKET